MDKKENKYPSFNSSPSGGGRKNSSSGQFRTSIDGKNSDVYSNSSSDQSRGNPSNQRPGGRSGDFSVNIPKNAGSATPAKPPRNPKTNGVPAGKTSPRANAYPQANPRLAGTAKKEAPEPKRSKAPSSPAKAPSRKRTTVGSPRVSAEEKRLKREKKRRARLRSLLATIVCVVFIGLITVTLSVIAISTINDILCIGKESGATISVVVEKGDDFEKVFNKLCDNGLVAQKQLSHFFCQYRKYDTVKYEPGVYYFDTSDGVEAMLEEMMVSKKNSNSIVRLTFPEGWSTAKIFQKIEKYEVCSADKLYANLDIIGEQYKFYKNIKSKTGRYLMTEGYLFPDTYEFYKGESAASVLKKLFSNFNEHWLEEYTTRAKELGLSVDEVLTIASIIQREAGSVDQMKDISSVIHNRLNSTDFKMLELDSTSDYIYSINSNFSLFSEHDYSVYYESYNTYSNEGLPPGPICNPGKSSIEAALYPNETGYFFFAHDKNGEIYLASSKSEHEQNLSTIFAESD